SRAWRRSWATPGATTRPHRPGPGANGNSWRSGRNLGRSRPPPLEPVLRLVDALRHDTPWSGGSMGHRTAIALAIIVPVVGSATWVWASEDDQQSSEIHACVQRRSGQLRIVGQGDRCHSDEASITWNTAGPAGAAG